MSRLIGRASVAAARRLAACGPWPAPTRSVADAIRLLVLRHLWNGLSGDSTRVTWEHASWPIEAYRDTRSITLEACFAKASVLLDRWQRDQGRVADALQPLDAAMASIQRTDPPSTPPLSEVLGIAYETLCGYRLVGGSTVHGRTGADRWRVDRTRRRSAGLYYTPREVVRHLVEGTLRPAWERHLQTVGEWMDRGTADWSVLDRLCHFRVLDPAMGSGLFLFACGRWLGDRAVAWWVEHGGDPAAHQAIRVRLLRDSLFGCDLDPWAVRIAMAGLSHAAGLPPCRWQRRLVCHDGLDPRLPFTESDASGSFDVVIGNPPFMSYSGRQARLLPNRYGRWWGTALREDAWPSLHGLFVRQAVVLSRCTVGLVLPAQVGQLEGYGAVRRAFQAGFQLHEVRYWGEALFPGATTPALTAIAVADERRRTTRIVPAVGEGGSVRLEGAVPWVAPSRQADLARRLCRLPGRLGSLVGDIGIHTGNAAAILMSDKRPPAGDWRPVLEGRQIGRYRCAPPRRYVRVDVGPSGNYYFRRLPATRYRAARFLIRQTAPHPIVGPRRGADFFRNSLLALFDPPAPFDVRFVVGLLNSKLIRFLYRELTADAGQRRFPQVKIATLRALPIVWPDRANADDWARHDRIVAHVRKLLRWHGGAPDEAAHRGEAAHAEQVIDQAVFELYRLSETERALLDENGEAGP